MSRDLGDFLAEGGAIVGGGAALGATVGFIAASIVQDFRPQKDIDVWTRNLAAFGGVVGLVALLDRGVDFSAVKRQRRFYVMLAVSAVAGLVYARIARDWSFGAFLAGEAAVIVLVGGFGLPWMEFSPNGAFRRHPET